MNIEEICDYCLAKPAVTEGFPFGGTVRSTKSILDRLFIYAR
jgi:hypothetical protein